MVLEQSSRRVVADVIVVGAGNAALCAALAARAAGARVIVLEAAPQVERGGNSRFAGGIFRFVHDGLKDLDQLMTQDGRQWTRRIHVEPYTAEHYLADLQSTSAGRCDPTLIKLLVDKSRSTVEWMCSNGVQFEFTVGKLVDANKVESGQTYELTGGGAVRTEHEGVGLIANLFAAAQSAGVEVQYESPAQQLIMSGDHAFGVRVRKESGFVDYLGAVVLASGGFEASPEMRQQYLGAGWDLVKVRGSRFNTGVMLREALNSGAQAYGHWGGCHASPLDADAPSVGDLAITDKLSRYSFPYGLLVNRSGERFLDEGEDQVWLTYAKTGAAIRSQPEGVAFQLFDQKTIHLLEPRYSTGVPVESHTIGGLAELLGINAQALEHTVDEFNAATRPGAFDPFSKDGLSTRPGLRISKSNWAQPLDRPPYVAYRVTCGITFTYGGLRIDESARVLNREGKPLRGLYATGEITGGFFFHNYPGGAGLMRGSVFGRIAGEMAASFATARAELRR